jgi:uncharacterized protein YwgA
MLSDVKVKEGSLHK